MAVGWSDDVSAFGASAASRLSLRPFCSRQQPAEFVEAMGRQEPAWPHTKSAQSEPISVRAVTAQRPAPRVTDRLHHHPFVRQRLGPNTVGRVTSAHAEKHLTGGDRGRGAALPSAAPLMAQGEADAPGGGAPGTIGGTVKLKDLVPAATNTVNTTFIVLDKAAPTARPPYPHPQPHAQAQARGGEEVTCLALVADETAAAHFLLWGGECGAFEPGDIVRLTGGIFSYHRGNALVLRAGRRGRAEKVDEFTMLFVETPNMSEIQWGRDPDDPRRMVQEAVVSPCSQVFKPLR